MGSNKIEHTEEYLKRLAKKIKKESGITHTRALDKAAEQKGFNNWNHFRNAKD